MSKVNLYFIWRNLFSKFKYKYKFIFLNVTLRSGMGFYQFSNEWIYLKLPLRTPKRVGILHNSVVVLHKLVTKFLKGILLTAETSTCIYTKSFLPLNCSVLSFIWCFLSWLSFNSMTTPGRMSIEWWWKLKFAYKEPLQDTRL